MVQRVAIIEVSLAVTVQRQLREGGRGDQLLEGGGFKSDGR